MKKIFLLLTISLFTLNSFSQATFNWNPNDTIIIDNLDPNDYSEFLIEQVNIMDDTLILAVEVVYNTIPQIWDGMVCIYGTCFGMIPPVGSSSTMDPIYDAINGYVKLTVNPLGDMQTGGVIRVRVYDTSNPSDPGDTCTWIVNSIYTSINGVESNNLSVFPNPTTDKITISSVSNFTKIEVLDINGRVVISENTLNANITSVDVSQLLNGTYFVNTYNNNIINNVQKFTIEK